MPKRTDIQHILVIGSGPIVIGQACEFDYSGTQACRVLRAEGFRVSLINSGGASAGDSDLKEAVKTAVINKRAGGMGLISGRKAFQRPFAEGVELLNAIQDVYLNPEVTLA